MTGGMHTVAHLGVIITAGLALVPSARAASGSAVGKPGAGKVPLLVDTDIGGDIDDTWAVSTFVVNHQRTLSFTHLYAVVAVDKNDSTVGVTLVKKGADS